MEPMTMAAIGAGVSLISRLIGEAIAAGDIERAERLKQQAVAEYGEEILPQLEEVERLQVAETGLARIPLESQGRAGQTGAMGRLESFMSSQWSPEDAAELRRAQDAAGGIAGRAAASASQLAASRGLRRSGLEQALAQQGAQAAAQTGADVAADLGAARRARQLQSIGMFGNLSGALRSDDYGQQSDAARAQDDINRFNANLALSTNRQRNQTRLDAYDAQMDLKRARNAARMGQADFYGERAARNRQTAADIGGGIQGGLQGGADYMERDALNKQKYGGRGGK